jgi:hypothetical protein
MGPLAGDFNRYRPITLTNGKSVLQPIEPTVG